MDEREEPVLFTKEMKKATRNIHNISDTLVNAKLGIAMSDDRVWAEGLLIFYEIFRYLEEATGRLKMKIGYFDQIAKILEGIERTQAFESDLTFYYGENFLKTTNYIIRPSVGDYLKHLKNLEDNDPLRILAYIYHLYMGLLSGGQILKKKRELRQRIFKNLIPFLANCDNDQNKSSSSEASLSERNLGNQVTSFEDGRSISDMKKEIVFTMNQIAEELSQTERDSILEESIKVFQMNNHIVATIQNTNIIAIKNIINSPIFLIFLIIIIILVVLFVFLFM